MIPKTITVSQPMGSSFASALADLVDVVVALSNATLKKRVQIQKHSQDIAA
jgi:hypothetical protein